MSWSFSATVRRSKLHASLKAKQEQLSYLDTVQRSQATHARHAAVMMAETLGGDDPVVQVSLSGHRDISVTGYGSFGMSLTSSPNLEDEDEEKAKLEESAFEAGAITQSNIDQELNREASAEVSEFEEMDEDI